VGKSPSERKKEIREENAISGQRTGAEMVIASPIKESSTPTGKRSKEGRFKKPIGVTSKRLERMS